MTFNTSVACNTTLPPVNSSNVEPLGMLTVLANDTFEFVSVSLVSDSNSTSTVTAVVCMLQRSKPIIIVVVDVGPV